VITRTTKVQLVVFVLLSVVGVTYVGARYAQLDRLVTDDTYTVSADFAESGGVYVGAEVTYRGVPVGRVEALRLSDDGVTVDLGIDDGVTGIPADARAVVANRSAVGEQYVDLQPSSEAGPYLREGSTIARTETATPVAAEQLLVDLDDLVSSVDPRELRTVVAELGAAFEGSGPDIAQIIDTGNAFISDASASVDVTTSLVRNSDVALRGQLASASAIRSFSRDLRLFSTTLVASDPQLRDVLDHGAEAARSVRRVVADNADDLAVLIDNVVTTGEVTAARLDGIEQVLVLYPHVVQGGYTVVSKDPLTGLYDAHFGLVLTQDPPVCHQGYERDRSPDDLSERRLSPQVGCAEPAAESNARGAQNAPAYQSPSDSEVVARYDPKTGEVTPTRSNPDAGVSLNGGQRDLLGDDSWKWLLLGPLGEGAR
jgi:phospholipid/cholesterol/gamma-HCH transport system substrate-binding protein